jgi:hypothetical protein
LLDKKEIQEIEVDLSFWESLAKQIQTSIEDRWMQCLKVWDFIEDITVQCHLPSLGPQKISIQWSK